VDNGNLLVPDDLGCVPVTIIDDNRIEAQESFSLTLAMDAHDLDVNITEGTATIVIQDNDGKSLIVVIADHMTLDQPG
jgi:hypothetical protein